MRAEPGALVVSLDLDLRGRVGEAVVRVLDLLAEREIHATWALVGLERAGAELDPLLATILARPNQAIGTQTVACYDGEQPRAAQLDRELGTAIAIAAQRGVQIESLVFPRSLCRAEYLPVLKRHGINSYRGRRRGWAHADSGLRMTAALRRGLCLADNFSLLIPDAATSMARLAEQAHGHALDIPASRYVRPFEPRLRKLDPLRVHRMQSEMITAAEAGWVYHLWLRPQQLDEHLYENAEVLDNLLRNARALAGRVNFRSLTMAELARELLSARPQPPVPT